MVRKSAAKPQTRGSQTKPLDKGKSTTAPTQKTPEENTTQLSASLQQSILDIFSQTFNDTLTSSTFTTTLQEVKQALFDRDFARAFQNPEYLDVYAARWSPTRALCYAAVMSNLSMELEQLISSEPGEDTGAVPGTLRALCIGGGAAELMAFGAYLHETPGVLRGDLTLLDSGPWDSIVSKLGRGLTTPPPLSKYANEAKKAANVAFLDENRLSAKFVQQDVLSLDKVQLSELVGSSPCLVTLLFTLNELFTSSGIGKTTTFLLHLTSALAVGSLLLVVDSPGSYSEMVVGSQAKKYPMQWLLEKILIGTAEEPIDGRRWTKLESHDSIWFRIPDTVRYPISLENMRYQMHLYRLDDADIGIDAASTVNTRGNPTP